MFAAIKRFAIGTFAFGCILPLFLNFLFHVVDDLRLSINQKTIKAEVTSVTKDWEERDDGRRMVQVFYFRYRFRIADKDYYGNGESDSEPSEKVTVAYDPINPNNNRIRTDWVYRYIGSPLKLALLMVATFFIIRFLLRAIIENYKNFFSENGLLNQNIKVALLCVICLVFVPAGFFLRVYQD